MAIQYEHTGLVGFGHSLDLLIIAAGPSSMGHGTVPSVPPEQVQIQFDRRIGILWTGRN